MGSISIFAGSLNTSVIICIPVLYEGLEYPLVKCIPSS